MMLTQQETGGQAMMPQGNARTAALGRISEGQRPRAGEGPDTEIEQKIVMVENAIHDLSASLPKDKARQLEEIAMQIRDITQ